MSALSRLRRALPLAQRLAQAPGACRGFSDLASGLPGRGRGGGGQSDGPSGAPGSSGSRLVEPAASHSLQDSRYDDAEEGAMAAASSRAPGDRRQQSRRGGRRRRGGGRRQEGGGASDSEDEGAESGGEEFEDAEQEEGGAPRRRGGRSGRSALQRAGGDSLWAAPVRADADYSEAVGNHVVLQPADPKDPNKLLGEQFPITDLVSDAELSFDPSRVWQLKYVLGQHTLDRLMAGQLRGEELAEAVDKVEATVLMSPAEREGLAKQYMQTTWLDPHYRLMDNVGVAPSTGPGAGRGGKLPSPHAVLEAWKEPLMQMTGMSEEEFAEAKAELSEEFKEVRPALERKQLMPKDYEERMVRLLERSLPADHPMYASVKEKLQVVAANPSWPGPSKIVFTKRLLKTVTAA